MKLTENLLTLGKQNRPGQKLISVNAVVFHWLAAPNQKPENTRAWWNSAQAFGSAHYVIGTDGLIMRTIPEGEVAFHIGSKEIDPVSKKIYTNRARNIFPSEAFVNKKNEDGFFITPNFYAIGIELSHLNNDPGNFSSETILAALELCRDIMQRHNWKPAISTHHEIVGWKNCPKLWTDKPELFEAFKQDVYLAKSNT